MFLWFSRLFEREQILLCMRLDDMLWVHPQMDSTRVCSQCGTCVGIYPSGQKILKRYRKVKIVCHVCREPDLSTALPAPGAIEESRKSYRR